jgi:hypothetical protein
MGVHPSKSRKKDEKIWVRQDVPITFGECHNQIIVLNEDIMMNIFNLLPITQVLTLPLVCQSWNIFLKNNDYLRWVARCSKFPRGLQVKPEKFTWSEWYSFVNNNYHFTPTVLKKELSYLRNNFAVTKLERTPDTSVALVSRVFMSGTAYCEFDIEKLNDELLVGVTNDAKYCISHSGFQILANDKVWGVWDKRGVQFCRTKTFSYSSRSRYRTGHRIGVYVDVEKSLVMLFRDGVLIHQTIQEEEKLVKNRSLYGNEGFQFFALLDYPDDIVTISKCYIDEKELNEMMLTTTQDTRTSSSSSSSSGEGFGMLD